MDCFVALLLAMTTRGFVALWATGAAVGDDSAPMPP
jgi:hypothetical protein